MASYKDCLTVSGLNSIISEKFEKQLSNIWVKGEISNYHHHTSSGHMYFTLKDASSEMKCVMFRLNNSHLRFSPCNGMSVRIFGSIKLYEKKGEVQLKISTMEQEGIGDLYKSFEELKKMLGNEGLFDQKHKKEIPPYPKAIGILTSETGAAIKDILDVLDRRSPHILKILYPVKVQGDGASEDLVEGIEIFNQYKDIDIIIIGRGGGSIEDLWCFNEEIVARAIFNSKIPIISAVGHQTDFTISDFVCDLRAPTPSAGAELSGPNFDDLLRRLKNHKNRLINMIKNYIEQKSLYLDQFDNRISNQKPTKKLKAKYEVLENLKQRMVLSVDTKQNFIHEKLKYFVKQLNNLDSKRILEKGYALPIKGNNKIIRDANEIAIGETFTLKMLNNQLIAKKISVLKENKN